MYKGERAAWDLRNTFSIFCYFLQLLSCWNVSTTVGLVKISKMPFTSCRQALVSDEPTTLGVCSLCLICQDPSGASFVWKGSDIRGRLCGQWPVLVHSLNWLCDQVEPLNLSFVPRLLSFMRCRS